MPYAGRQQRPSSLKVQVQKVQKVQKFQDSWCVQLVEGLLEVRKVSFQVTLYKDGCLNGWWVRIWIGAGREPCCAEECLDLFQNIIPQCRFTIPQCRFTWFVKIVESATGSVILPMGFSLLSWWDTTHVLQIVLIYHGMKLINTLCLSHLCCNQRLAGKASLMGNIFLPFFLLNELSVWKYCVYFDSCCLNSDCSSWKLTYPHLIWTFMCRLISASMFLSLTSFQSCIQKVERQVDSFFQYMRISWLKRNPCNLA
jgi:hypothetical protein